MIYAPILAEKDKIAIDAQSRYRGVLAANLKSVFLISPSIVFFEILDLSSPNIRQKYLLKTKCLNFFSLQTTAVDRCGA